ncbi:hypothetical protein BC831DRAFT_293933 [Entophlyctis helioformis]|nr:hypothetical protein BC831DRAFT_293933 [Entophlyctis helioformis]
MDRAAASDVHDARLCHTACACRLQRSQDGWSVRVQPGRHWHRRHPAAEHQCSHAERWRAVHDQADGDPGCRAHHARSRAWIQDQRRARGRQQEHVTGLRATITATAAAASVCSDNGHSVSHTHISIQASSNGQLARSPSDRQGRL